MSTLFTGISELRTVSEGTIEDAALVADAGCVAWVGKAGAAPAADERVDFGGLAVLPGWVDSHTHMVFDGNRANEFEARMAGESYAAGGIRATMSATRQAGEARLRSLVAERTQACHAGGTTTVESKTGYGLDIPTEVLSAKIAGDYCDDITFLGAHVVPPEWDADSYTDLVAGDMLDAVAEYVQWIDVFCEEGAFTAEQCRAVLEAGKKHGLGLRVHGNQLGEGPGIQLAVEMGAASVDHVTFPSDGDIEALAGSETVATMLPGADISTRHPLAPGRALLDAGVTLAIASDLNPGTSYTSAMNWCVGTAVLQAHLTFEEALEAGTLGGAMALRRHDVGGGKDAQGRPAVGALSVGCAANLHVLNTPHAVDIAYRPGMPLDFHTYIMGKRVF
ncbi:imidazolonepropionase [Corynebacterium pyruviciproducens ATCC BAA-1742]|uniref:Imidazolonepropionase n=1 Tax=Corynebacterium pyruviciproducens ATCC BAA-1742 TaxID=1125779 RepID=S2Z146_9CORY|nr:imidazolonepropionase [Corynebacterium pyruviciproducens]EPD70181.1 imidazolonepropionase [Corynebacterium pyruviciproducens ATCC BAA-1742]